MQNTSSNPPLHPPKPLVWCVAGNDSGGGAGLSADQRAVAALGGHACPVVATLTAQSSLGVTQVVAVDAQLLDAQLAALAADQAPAAIKTGLLGNAAQVRVLAQWVDRLRQRHPHLPLVIDPVHTASSGLGLTAPDTWQALVTELLPRATVVTPNRAEALRLLAGLQHANANAAAAEMDDTQLADALKAWVPALPHQQGPAWVLTGGDDPQAPASGLCVDTLLAPEAQGQLVAPRLDTPHTHGTGCTFASAAATALAQGFTVADAVVLAKWATTHGLRHSHPAGQGAGPLQPSPGFIHHPPPVLRSRGAEPPANTPAFARCPQALGQPLGLYAVVDHADWVERVLACGIRTVQLRIKAGTPLSQPVELRAHIRASVAAAAQAGADLYINDHWALALEAGATSLHLGQEDVQVAPLAELARAGVRLGLSTHSVWEVAKALAWQPSYVACGPIHATQSKDMPWLPQGEGNIRFWQHALRHTAPVVVIGGMTPERVRTAAAHGAAGVAVMSGITAAPNPEAALAQLQAAWAQGRRAFEEAPPDLPARPRPTLRPHGREQPTVQTAK